MLRCVGEQCCKAEVDAPQYCARRCSCGHVSQVSCMVLVAHQNCGGWAAFGAVFKGATSALQAARVFEIEGLPHNFKGTISAPWLAATE